MPVLFLRKHLLLLLHAATTVTVESGHFTASKAIMYAGCRVWLKMDKLRLLVDESFIINVATTPNAVATKHRFPTKKAIVNTCGFQFGSQIENDFLSEKYSVKCQELSGQSADAWDGIWNLTEK